jgi:hypothetical protein
VLRAAVGVIVLACLCGCGAGAPAPSARASGTGTATTAGTNTATTTTTAGPRPHHHHHRARPNPGALPQTEQLPSAHTATFHAEMRALWSAIRTGSPNAGLPAFFPEAAYAQVKAIADPAADWQDRLVADYTLDLGAAHALLGADARHARLIDVEVPAAYAHWVPPNVCYNSVGYYEVPNSRVVYDEAGETRSLGIASMISWRGVWYVIHLGAVLRDAAAGVVDDPSAGAGTPVPSSTC